MRVALAALGLVACSQSTLTVPLDLGADQAPVELGAPMDLAHDFAPRDFATDASIDFAVDLPAPFDGAPADFIPADLATIISPPCMTDACAQAILAAFQSCWMPTGACAEVTTHPMFNETVVTECFADQSSVVTDSHGTRASTQTYKSSNGATCVVVGYSPALFGAEDITITAGGHTWQKTTDPLDGTMVTCDGHSTGCDLPSAFPNTDGLCPQASSCPGGPLE
jgi:hypothetical protein